MSFRAAGENSDRPGRGRIGVLLRQSAQSASCLQHPCYSRAAGTRRWLRPCTDATFAVMNPDAEPAVAKELSYRGAAARVIAGLWIAAIVYTVAVMPLAARTSGRAIAPGPIVEQIILLLLWGAATPAILLSAERLPLDRPRWLRNGIAHGLIATVFIVAINVVAPALTWIVLRRPFDIAAILRHGTTALVSAFPLELIVSAFHRSPLHSLH